MAGEKINLLFIEDETKFQKSIIKLFEAEGFSVISAYDGEAGLRLAQENCQILNLILLDLILPKIDGFDVLEKIKENPCLSNIPVVVLTNLESVLDIEKVMSLGAKAFLVKANYTVEDILKKVKEILKVN